MTQAPHDKDNPPVSNESGYYGAKPAAVADAGWGLFGERATVPSDAMSARLARNWWAFALRGFFAVLFGAIALALPGITLISLVLVFAAYMLVDGVFAIVAGIFAARRHERWALLVLEGIADLAAGAIALIWPLITILVFVYLVGAWAIVSGALLWRAAFRLNLQHGRWLMGLSGFVSLLWGIMLVAWPSIGAVALTWWIGAYALLFGGLLLVLAYRLHRLRRELPADVRPQRA
jgi:uncharacterized membrane protein HdeD (DUF308 family)